MYTYKQHTENNKGRRSNIFYNFLIYTKVSVEKLVLRLIKKESIYKWCEQLQKCVGQKVIHEQKLNANYYNTATQEVSLAYPMHVPPFIALYPSRRHSISYQVDDKMSTLTYCSCG